MWIGDKETIFRFRPRDNTPEEVERARLAAVERRRELEAERLATLEVVVREDARPCEEDQKDSGVRGVYWRKLERCWTAMIMLLGKMVQKRFKPADFSSEAIEAARVLAIQWRRDMERRKAAELDC
mmetsp:Transcript_61573/g.190740  ORF Transcript_61573/g.190740 Transcript_61573/m.190740 type:complete len:126 (+) Transcript_61573:3-380(+)